MESIGEHGGVVTAIGAEVASVLAAVSRAYPLAEQPPPDLNLQRSETVLGGCLHSGRRLVSDGSCWAKMAGTAPLIVGTEVLWPVARSPVAWLTWRGRRLTLVR